MRLLDLLKAWRDALSGNKLRSTVLRNAQAADNLDRAVKEMLRK